MGFLYRKLLRRIFFTFDPETVHDAVMRGVRTLQRVKSARLVIEFMAKAKDRPLTVAGIRFRNPIGLAAGFDKNCEAPVMLAKLGFGFLELGTITFRAQNGNPRPRIFRLGAHKGLINRMGFNNVGAYEAARRLEKAGPVGVPVGVNIGKNADCSLEDAPKNYLETLKVLYPFCDYAALNISSPNTLRLRALHEKDHLARLLDPALDFINGAGVKKPLFVKIAPDLEDADLRTWSPPPWSAAWGSSPPTPQYSAGTFPRAGAPTRAVSAACRCARSPTRCLESFRAGRRQGAAHRGGRRFRRAVGRREIPSGRGPGAGLLGPYL